MPIHSGCWAHALVEPTNNYNHAMIQLRRKETLRHACKSHGVNATVDLHQDVLPRVLSAYRDKLTIDPNSVWKDGFLEWLLRTDFNSASEIMVSGRSPSFAEFIKYYLSPVDKNPHWKEYYRMCMPCVIDYDFIGLFENFKDEMKYIAKEFFQTEYNSSVAGHMTDSSANKSLNKYYSELSSKLLGKLCRHSGMTIDLELFGYNIPDTIKMLLNHTD
ncbi:carbohydrate sulfotransferase 12-like [Diadema setosum]|uniref:carbohydrate sulfotransferase 12-like n=1 Tax=Diadema setosum TaxID=31175 RepID=UPI003B3A1190